MILQFEFPVNLTAEKFIAQLSDHNDTQLVSRQHALKTFYDSFDWRLYAHGITCDFTRAKTSSSLTLRNLDNNLIIASMSLDEVPAFARQFKSGKVRGILESILEMRALLSLCKLDHERYQLNIFNSDQKTILRLLIEAYEPLNNYVAVQTIRGYEKTAEHIIHRLTTKLGLTPTVHPLLLSALKRQGRKPKEYTSKLNINLDPDMRADIASKYIYSYLLKIINNNEQGVINNTDSEFLHDFRVAVRRTRSGLSQIKGVLPDPINSYFTDFFSWLGQITGPTRDLDVYLLNFEHYKNSLPIAIREDLNPLYDFLLAKQQKSQRELAKKLQSEKYLSTLCEWEQYLKEEVQKNPPESHAKLTIKKLADLRIWKNFNRVLQEGNTITEQSEAEILHNLRKTCKKLRYLMEFFQNLYPENQIRQPIKSLKELQEVLGNIQDYQVQETHLKLFSEEMLSHNIPANTFLAMGVLIQNLDASRCKARNDFAAKFTAFKQAENQHIFKALFGTKD